MPASLLINILLVKLDILEDIPTPLIVLEPVIAPSTCSVEAISTAPSISTTSKLVVPSTSISPEMSRDALTIKFPVIVPPPKGSFVAMALVTVVLKAASSLRAAAISLRVFIVPGAESIKALTAAVTYAVVAILVVLSEAL